MANTNEYNPYDDDVRAEPRTKAADWDMILRQRAAARRALRRLTQGNG